MTASRPHHAWPTCSNVAWKHFCLSVCIATDNILLCAIGLNNRWHITLCITHCLLTLIFICDIYNSTNLYITSRITSTVLWHLTWHPWLVTLTLVMRPLRLTLDLSVILAALLPGFCPRVVAHANYVGRRGQHFWVRLSVYLSVCLSAA